MDREADHRHFGVWIALFVTAMVVAYPLSFGPVLWAELNVALPEWLVISLDWLYGPMNLALESGPDWLVDAFDWYLEFWEV
jgi:hypothetical protein